MSDESLDDLLSDQEPAVEPETPEEPPEESPEPTESATEEAPEEEASSESTGEKEDEPPSSETDNLTEKERALLAKAQDYKRKWQEAERKKESEKKPEEVPDQFEDPQGYQQYMERKLSQSEIRTKVTMSQAFMRRQHEDYDQAESKFTELAKEDPSLVQKAMQSDFPAEFVYNYVKKHEKFEQFGSFDDAVKGAVEQEKAKLEKSIREQLQKEYDEKLKKAGSLPPSGAGGSKGSDNTAAPHETLSDILGEKK